MTISKSKPAAFFNFIVNCKLPVILEIHDINVNNQIISNKKLNK